MTELQPDELGGDCGYALSVVHFLFSYGCSSYELIGSTMAKNGMSFLQMLAKTLIYGLRRKI